MWPLEKSEREKWANHVALVQMREGLGIPALDEMERYLHGRLLPRGVTVPRFMNDRPPVNYWMEPYQLASMRWGPGQILLGKAAGNFIGHMDDRMIVTDAGARSGKTATVLDRMRWAIKVRVGLPRFAPDPPGRQEPPQKGPRNARMAREIAVELAKAASSCPADAVAVPPE